MPDYDAMAADYADHPPTADEVVDVEVSPFALKTGRPRKGATKGGRTPTMSLRLPDKLRQKVAQQAKAEGVAESELIRRAVDEYVTHHTR